MLRKSLDSSSEIARSEFSLYSKRSEKLLELDKLKHQKRHSLVSRISQMDVLLNLTKKKELDIMLDKRKNPKKYQLLKARGIPDIDIHEKYADF